METQNEVPDWNCIRFITTDLIDVLDNFVDDSTPIPEMRVKLARTIAQMRDEKGAQEERRRVLSSPEMIVLEMTNEIRDRLKAALSDYRESSMSARA